MSKPYPGQNLHLMIKYLSSAVCFVAAKRYILYVGRAGRVDLDIHLHVPSGAQPKDGPSAGVTMATALVSLISKRPVRSDVGMTGEITLRGQVLPVGGIKEKVLAAHRSGLKTVVLPRRNEADLEELPEEVLKEIKFEFVDVVDQVINVALEPAPKKREKIGKGKKSSKD